ncbi:hypothetical protein RvY_15594 [Ramazzottius varieornatus]|uniref:Uncharacterized protein n=1 Tax=Ramazzottius varieornatus TaxID=947166 RepID=A0A1D1VYN5_RAMVA|nr:hypothetical protein RvY_15594 [Ramazzottius varieornatus]
MPPGSTACCEVSSTSETLPMVEPDQCPDAAAVIQAIDSRIESLQSFGRHTLLELISLDEPHCRPDINRKEEVDGQTRQDLEERRYRAHHLEQALSNLRNDIQTTAHARANIAKENDDLRSQIHKEREKWCELDKRIELEAATRNNSNSSNSSSRIAEAVRRKIPSIADRSRFRT